MRRLILALSLVPTLAAAAPKPPDAVLIPLPDLQRLEQLLSDPAAARDIPMYQADFVPLMQAIDACAAMQVPDQNGVTRDTGRCPAVTAALAAREKEVADLKAELAKLKAPAPVASGPTVKLPGQEATPK